MEQSLPWQLCSLCSSPANAQKAVTAQRGEQENQSPVRPGEEARRGQERLVRSPARLLQAWHRGSSTTAFSGVAASCHRSEEAAFCLGGQRRRQGGWEARAGQRRKEPGAHGQHPLLAPGDATARGGRAGEASSPPAARSGPAKASPGSRQRLENNHQGSAGRGERASSTLPCTAGRWHAWMSPARRSPIPEGAEANSPGHINGSAWPKARFHAGEANYSWLISLLV